MLNESKCFSHGQLYVACSRVTNCDSLMILPRVDRDNKIEFLHNVVYQEMYWKDNNNQTDVPKGVLEKILEEIELEHNHSRRR